MIQLLLSEGQLGIKKQGTAKEKPPVRVPVVRVKLVESLSVPPLRCVPAGVELEGEEGLEGPFGPQPVRLEDSLFGAVGLNEVFHVVLENHTGFTQRVEKDTQVGLAMEEESEQLPTREILKSSSNSTNQHCMCSKFDTFQCCAY